MKIPKKFIYLCVNLFCKQMQIWWETKLKFFPVYYKTFVILTWYVSQDQKSGLRSSINISQKKKK